MGFFEDSNQVFFFFFSGGGGLFDCPITIQSPCPSPRKIMAAKVTWCQEPLGLGWASGLGGGGMDWKVRKKALNQGFQKKKTF